MDSRSQDQNKSGLLLKLGIFLLLYAGTIVVQINSQQSQYLNGIVCQIQVLISVFIVMSVRKTGYIVAAAANGFDAVLATFSVVRNHNAASLTGVIICLCTLVIISVISFYGRRLHKRMEEIAVQKEQISKLYKELFYAQEEMSKQNEQLLEYNRAMRENEEKLHTMAYYDELTGLPNRKMLIGSLEKLICQSQSDREHTTFAVVFLDLDNFKSINDTSGHHVGDILLREVAKRLESLTDPQDVLGRLGGDEFALIIQRPLNHSQMLEYIDRFSAALTAKFHIEEKELFISGSWGISIYPQDGEESADLLKYADAAMYRAKDLGKNRIRFFNEAVQNELSGLSAIRC